VKSGISKKLEIFKYVMIYSSMGPFGLLLGAALAFAVSGTAQVILNGIVSGIAAGTFIYISLVDILLREFNDPTDKYIKYGLCWLGFALITSSILLFDDED